MPLSVTLSGANVPDGQKMLETVDAVEPVRGKGGRPRPHPKKLHADKAYDDGALRRELRKRSIVPRMARRGLESSERLGRHRWVVNARLVSSKDFAACECGMKSEMTSMKRWYIWQTR